MSMKFTQKLIPHSSFELQQAAYTSILA